MLTMDGFLNIEIKKVDGVVITRLQSYNTGWVHLELEPEPEEAGRYDGYLPIQHNLYPNDYWGQLEVYIIAYFDGDKLKLEDTVAEIHSETQSFISTLTDQIEISSQYIDPPAL